MFVFKEYSLMAEPWSSKPLAWVRFLLLLITLVKHTSTALGKKRHKNYKGRKNSLFTGSKTSFFVTNLTSGARRATGSSLPFKNGSRVTKIKYQNYKLSSSKHNYLSYGVRLAARQVTAPHYRYKQVNFKTSTTSSIMGLLFVVLNKTSLYGFKSSSALPTFIAKVLCEVNQYVHPLTTWQSSAAIKGSTARTLNLVTTPINFNFSVSKQVPSSFHYNRKKGLHNYPVYAKAFRRCASTLTFLKLLPTTCLTSKLPTIKVSTYFSKRKKLLRGLQNALVATTFLRFYNYRAQIQDVSSSAMVVTKHQLTRSDNWLLHNTRTNPLWPQRHMARELFHLTNVGTEFNASRSETVVAPRASNAVVHPFSQPSFDTPRQYPSGVKQQTGLQLNSRLFQRTLDSTLLYKYVMLLFSWSDHSKRVVNGRLENSLLNFVKEYFFESRTQLITRTNLLPSDVLSYRIRTKFTSLFLKNPFHVNVTMWYHTMLIRFIENCSGLKVGLAFNPFLENTLTYTDVARCSSWADRVFDFRRLLGPKIFIKESLKVFHLAFRLKDPTFLSAWIREMLKRTSFWKYRVLFRYIKYLVRHLFFTVFDDLQFKGFKLKLKGKISVGGNSRARTLMYRVGETSQSTFKNKITHDLNFVYTFTGVMGFQLWFYF